MNASCPLVFKLNVQSICQDRIEISFEMTGLRYLWIPVPNHSISIAKQSLARQCWSVLVCIESQ